jgi:hypothetical protein
MDFLEKNLEDIIYETDNNLLTKRGLFIYGKKKRQVRIGNYGVADIITYYRGITDENEPELIINIYELKKDIINIDTFLQALRYYKGICRYLDKRDFYENVRYRLILIGKTIDPGDFKYLTDFAYNINIFTYSYQFDGIKFTQERGYRLINEGF